MKPRKRTAKPADPFLRACTGCGAGVGEGCKTFGKGGSELPLVLSASRLVHAVRLEQPKGPHA